MTKQQTQRTDQLLPKQLSNHTKDSDNKDDNAATNQQYFPDMGEPGVLLAATAGDIVVCEWTTCDVAPCCVALCCAVWWRDQKPRVKVHQFFCVCVCVLLFRLAVMRMPTEREVHPRQRGFDRQLDTQVVSS